MEDLLVDKEQWAVVHLGAKPATMSSKDWEKLDRKARRTICLCCLDSVLLNVSGEDFAKKPWEKLGNLYQSKSLVKKCFYKKNCIILGCVDGGKNPSQQRGSLPVPQVAIRLTNIWYGRPDRIMDLLPSRG